MNAVVDLTPMDRQESEQAKAQPLTVIEHAIRSGASPDQLERMLELQVRADNHQLELMREKRRMDEEDRKAAALLAYRRDFAAFRGQGIVVPKTKHVDRGVGGSFDQAEFFVFSRMLSPALSQHGFSFRHDQKFGSKSRVTDGVASDIPWVYVTCFLEHKDGHSERLDLEGPPADTKVNTPVQNMQVTASVLKRQSLAAITGTATGGEDDENKLKGPRGNKGPTPAAVDDVDALLQRLVAEVQKRPTDEAALAYWNKEKGQLAQWPNAYAEFKDETVKHRAALAAAAGATTGATA